MQLASEIFIAIYSSWLHKRHKLFFRSAPIGFVKTDFNIPDKLFIMLFNIETDRVLSEQTFGNKIALLFGIFYHFTVKTYGKPSGIIFDYIDHGKKPPSLLSSMGSSKGSSKNKITFYPSRLQVIFARSGGGKILERACYSCGFATPGANKSNPNPNA
jgi:hypothetical protein